MVDLTDINSGAGNSNLSEMVFYEDQLHFLADDGNVGKELFKKDGANIVLIEDINPGPTSSMPNALKVMNNTLYFVANNGTDGSELHSWDGTIEIGRASCRERV